MKHYYLFYISLSENEIQRVLHRGISFSSETMYNRSIWTIYRKLILSPGNSSIDEATVFH